MLSPCSRSKISFLPCLLLCLGLQCLAPKPIYASQAGREFNEADAALNVAYKTLLAKLSDPEAHAQMVHAQVAWIKFRDENVAFFALRYPESKAGLFFKTYLTKERIAFLKAVRSEEEPEFENK